MRELEKHIGVVRRHGGNIEEASEPAQYRNSQPSSRCSSEEQQSGLHEGAAQCENVQLQHSHHEPIVIAGESSAAASANIPQSHSTALEHEEAGKHETQLCAGQLAVGGTGGMLHRVLATPPTPEVLQASRSFRLMRPRKRPVQPS